MAVVYGRCRVDLAVFFLTDPDLYGAHSLRTEVIIDMAHLGFEPTEMQEVSLHASLNQLIAYVRAVRHPSQQPAHHLAIQLQHQMGERAA